MENEIELKLLLPDGINESDLLTALTHFSANIETSEFTLFNQYFDTPESLLSAYGIGLRIRSSERGIEQTVKTAGTSIGGLHQRPEYNVAIDSLEPNLELFERHIWPAEINVAELQESIVQVFHTDFRRLAHLMRLADGTDIEVVYDRGQITTAENSADICEIELELKSGNVAVLFDLAQKICGIAVTQLCNISKAGRGFLLAKNQLAPDAQALDFVGISREGSCEDAFVKGLEYSLSFWQKAEYRYSRRKKIADLVDIYTGMNLTLTCLSIFNDVLVHDELTDLKKILSVRIKRWAWIEQVDSIKSLRSKRGMYAKPLAQHHALTSYLRGLQDGTLTLSRPMFLITQKDNTLLQLALSKLLVTKPWRASGSQHEVSIREHASRQLAKSWGHVFSTFANKGMGAEDYLKHAAKLRDGLRVNCLLGKAYSEFRRQPFNAPWQDILEGIDELHTINVLKTKLKDSDVEDKAELIQWCEVKKNTLLSVIDQSKAVATDVETYW